MQSESGLLDERPYIQRHPQRPRCDNEPKPEAKRPRCDNEPEPEAKRPRFEDFDEYFEWFYKTIKHGLKLQVRRQISECKRIGCLHCNVGFSFKGAIKCVAPEHQMLLDDEREMLAESDGSLPSCFAQGI